MGYEVEPSIRIAAPQETVWGYLVDVEEWWAASNPEHESPDILTSTDPIEGGTRIECLGRTVEA